jgi:hypothetical protein
MKLAEWARVDGVHPKPRIGASARGNPASPGASDAEGHDPGRDRGDRDLDPDPVNGDGQDD